MQLKHSPQFEGASGDIIIGVLPLEASGTHNGRRVDSYTTIQPLPTLSERSRDELLSLTGSRQTLWASYMKSNLEKHHIELLKTRDLCMNELTALS